MVRPIETLTAHRDAGAVYLIGCDHHLEQTYQASKGPEARHLEFERILRNTIAECGPDLVAEEYHLELLKSRRRQSIALNIASEMRICHRFCDPSGEERQKLGIGRPREDFKEMSDYDWYKHEIAHRHPIREDFWISQIRDGIHKTTIFICGAMHISTFKSA